MEGEGRILALGNLFGPSRVWIVGGKAPPLPIPLDGQGLPLLVGGKGPRSVLVGLDGGEVTAWRLATLEAAYAAPIWDQLPAEHFRPTAGQHAFVGWLGSLPMKMAWRSWSGCTSETATKSWWERLFPDPDRERSPPETRSRREGIYCLRTYSWTFDSVAEYNARFERWYREWNPSHRWSGMEYGAKKGVGGVLLGLLTIERDGPAGELVLEMNPVAARDYAVALRECRGREPWCEEFLEFPVSLTVRREGAGSPLAPGAAVDGDSATWRFTLAEWMAASARAVWPAGTG